MWHVIWNIVGFGPTYLSIAEVSLIRRVESEDLDTNVEGTDGIDGAYCWRPVPLGVRICTGEVATGLELHLRVGLSSMGTTLFTTS